MTKKLIRSEKYLFSASEFDGYTINAAITMMKNLAESYGGDAIINYDYLYNDDYSGGYILVIEREETDEEYTKRLAYDKQIVKNKEDAERRQLYALLAKYHPDAVDK